MPFNGAGVFTRLFNWTADAGNNLPISSTKFDGEDNDFASGFTNCLTRDGQGKPTAALTWAQSLTLNAAADGTPLTVARTGGSNNPQLQFTVADATGITLNLTTAQTLTLKTPGGNATLSGTGNFAVAAPTSGVGITVTGVANSYAMQVTSGNIAGQDFGLNINAGSNASDTAFRVQNRAGSANYLGANGDGSSYMGPNGTGSLAVNAASNVTVGAPSSGTAFSATGIANALTASFQASTTASQSLGVRVFAGTNSSDESFRVFNAAGTSTYLEVRGDGALLAGFSGAGFVVTQAGNITAGAPTSGNTLTVNAVSGAAAAAFNGNSASGNSFGVGINAGTTSADYGLNVNNQASSQTYFRVRGDGIVLGNDGTSLFELGYKDLPVNNQTASYTLALSDRGKDVYFSAGTDTCTIPANASVAFPNGSTIVLINTSSNNVALNITSDTLNWLQGGTNTTGNRTIANFSVVTLHKITATNWVLTGNGIS